MSEPQGSKLKRNEVVLLGDSAGGVTYLGWRAAAVVPKPPLEWPEVPLEASREAMAEARIYSLMIAARSRSHAHTHVTSRHVTSRHVTCAGQLRGRAVPGGGGHSAPELSVFDVGHSSDDGTLRRLDQAGRNAGKRKVTVPVTMIPL